MDLTENGMENKLRILAAKGTPGNPQEKPRDLINPGDKGCFLEDNVSINIFYKGLCVSINGFDNTVAVSYRVDLVALQEEVLTGVRDESSSTRTR